MRDQERRVERLIREAQERRELDNLPGAGKPIPGLDKPHDEFWWVKQLLLREEISLAPALRLRKRVEETVDRIRRASTEPEVRRLLADQRPGRLRAAHRSRAAGRRGGRAEVAGGAVLKRGGPRSPPSCRRSRHRV